MRSSVCDFRMRLENGFPNNRYNLVWAGFSGKGKGGELGGCEGAGKEWEVRCRRESGPVEPSLRMKLMIDLLRQLLADAGHPGNGFCLGCFYIFQRTEVPQ